MPAIFILIVLLYIIFHGGKGSSASKKQESGSQPARTSSSGSPAASASRPASSASRPASSASRPSPAGYSATAYSAARNTAAARSSTTAHSFDSVHYHPEGYDFETCFSFKDVPPGVDELGALIAANSRHERQLEKLMHSSENT